MAQIVKDLTLQIHFSAIALADLIQFINHVTQVRADLLHLFITLAYAIGDHGFALTRIFELDALGEELAPVFMKIDFKNVVIRFLAEAIAIDFIGIGNA